MATAKITAERLDALKQGATLWDNEIRGFGARRGPRGITFIYKSREPVLGKQVLMTIGRRGRGDYGIDDARRVATGWALLIRDGKDPRGEPADAVAPMTVAELCGAYVEALPTMLLSAARRPKKESTIATDKSRIEAHIKPLLGSKAVTSVTTADIEAFLIRVAKGDTAKPRKPGRGGVARGGKGAATRTTGLLGAIFAYAVKRHIRADNPVRGVTRFADQRRERRLTDEEYPLLAAGLATMEASSPVAVAAIRFLALTGWRRGEAINLKWRDLDLKSRTATLGDTKTGRSIRPVANAAMDALKAVPTRAGNPYVFPASTGEGAIGSLPRVFAKVLNKAELPGDITPHVLRHSVASLASDAGLSEATIAGLLGHKLGTVTSRYTHAADAVMLKAADIVADRVLTLMGQEKPAGNVAQIHAA